MSQLEIGTFIVFVDEVISSLCVLRIWILKNVIDITAADLRTLKWVGQGVFPP